MRELVLYLREPRRAGVPVLELLHERGNGRTRLRQCLTEHDYLLCCG